MKIIYSLPHPADRLNSQQAGHVIRASAMLAALESLGHTIIQLEAATEQSTQTAVGLYRKVVKRMLPRPVAMRMRDTARISHGKRYANRLIEAIERTHPDVILETHIAFSLAGKIASEQTGVPLVLDDVAPAWEEEQQYGVGLKEAARDIHRQVTDRAKLLIAVNKTMRRNLIEEGLPESKIITVENGIDSRVFRLGVDGQPRRRQYNIPDDAVVIVFVGSFQHYHRVDLLLQAFAQIKTNQHAHLLLIGEGLTSTDCKALAHSLGLMDRVTFTGNIPYQDVASYVAAGDIAIMPATNDYGNPMKVYEYMAMGKPVIAPDQETITELVTHNQTAYLFAKENVAAMAAALQTLSEDAALRRRLGSAASQLAAQHTWEKRAETIQRALEAVGIPARP
ncbi:MAG: glycosyltransferase family 4 protein [Anaerolineae bacterium]|nr:glycosyltransferase family 4 protein [Anaerolineae bacterium]